MNPFKRYLNKLTYTLLRFNTRISQSPIITQWLKANGDKTHRVNYNLNTESIVFDLGGYEGQWASDIYSMYRCKIYVFEPVKKFAAAIQNRFRLNPDIKIFDFGLASENSSQKLYLQADGTSAFRGTNDFESIELKEMHSFLKQENVSGIDLLKINIEGGEYDVLEHLISTGDIKNIKNIQVQFHDFVPNAESRMKTIQAKLSLTHHLTYSFPFVWENWQIHA